MREIQDPAVFSNIRLPAISQEIWLIAIWILVSFLAAKLTHLVWSRIFLPIAKAKRTKLDVMVIEKTQHAMQLVVLTGLLDLGFRTGAEFVKSFSSNPIWNLSQEGVYAGFILSITLVLYEATIAATEWYGQRIAGNTAAAIDDQFLALFKKTARVVFFFVAATIILEHMGVKITGLLATAGVASLALAFAAQETLSNMISGFVLMIDRPFKIGDRIELSSGKTGDILEVGLRSTRIISPENTVLTIPNAELAKSQIVNLNLPNPNSKIRSSLGVAHGTDVRKAKNIIMDILTANPAVFKDPAPVVLFQEFGESALKIYYECWIADYRNQGRICDEVNMAIKDRFDEEAIQLASPRREVWMRKES